MNENAPDYVRAVDANGDIDIRAEAVGYFIRPTSLALDGSSVTPGTFPVRVSLDDEDTPGRIETTAQARFVASPFKRFRIRGGTAGTNYLVTLFRHRGEGILSAGPASAASGGPVVLYDSGIVRPTIGDTTNPLWVGPSGMANGDANRNNVGRWDVSSYKRVMITAMAYRCTGSATFGLFVYPLDNDAILTEVDSISSFAYGQPQLNGGMAIPNTVGTITTYDINRNGTSQTNMSDTNRVQNVNEPVNFFRLRLWYPTSFAYSAVSGQLVQGYLRFHIQAWA